MKYKRLYLFFIFLWLNILVNIFWRLQVLFLQLCNRFFNWLSKQASRWVNAVIISPGSLYFLKIHLVILLFFGISWRLFVRYIYTRLIIVICRNRVNWIVETKAIWNSSVLRKSICRADHFQILVLVQNRSFFFFKPSFVYTCIPCFFIDHDLVFGSYCIAELVLETFENCLIVFPIIVFSSLIFLARPRWKVISVLVMSLHFIFINNNTEHTQQ